MREHCEVIPRKAVRQTPQDRVIALLLVGRRQSSGRPFLEEGLTAGILELNDLDPVRSLEIGASEVQGAIDPVVLGRVVGLFHRLAESFNR